MRTDISTAMQTVLESGEFTVANVMAIHFDTPIYLTDYHHSLTVNSNVYQVIKGNSKSPKITETMESKKGTVTLELPNTDRVWDTIIQSNGFVDKWVNIGKAVFDNTGALIGILELWSGIATKPVTDETKVKISAASYHTIFQKTNGVKTNTASYQSHLTPAQRNDDRTMWWAGKASEFEASS
ncbi:MAG: hypothetical protein V7785_22035 [Bermanella sp.]